MIRVCGGVIAVTAVVPDGANRNMIFGTVVEDRRAGGDRRFEPGDRVWAARGQLAEL